MKNNNFIFANRADGKTEFLIKLANDLAEVGYKVEFYSLTNETIHPKLNDKIYYDLLPNNFINLKYILDVKKQKVKSGKIDFIFIDDIDHLDKWYELIELDCIKFITIDKRTLDDIDILNVNIQSYLNGRNYNLFNLKNIEYKNFSNPYLRDKKIDNILS